MRPLTIFLIFLYALLINIGCTTIYTPKPSPIESYKIPDLTFMAPVSIKNTQTSNEDVDLSYSNYTLAVNYREYTESVITLLKDELEKRGKTVSDDAHKTINIAVIDISLIPFAGSYICQIDLNLGAGNGYLVGREASAKSMYFRKAIKYAVADAVIKILNNGEILRYLGE